MFGGICDMLWGKKLGHIKLVCAQLEHFITTMSHTPELKPCEYLKNPLEDVDNLAVAWWMVSHGEYFYDTINLTQFLQHHRIMPSSIHCSRRPQCTMLPIKPHLLSQDRNSRAVKELDNDVFCSRALNNQVVTNTFSN